MMQMSSWLIPVLACGLLMLACMAVMGVIARRKSQ
jgi:hypothetical protein